MQSPGRPVAVISKICVPADRIDVYVSVSYEECMSKPPNHAELDTPDLKNRETYTISDLSEEFGVTARALRFYEDEGLIAPDRKGLSRIYTKRPSCLDHAGEKCRFQPDRDSRDDRSL